MFLGEHVSGVPEIATTDPMDAVTTHHVDAIYGEATVVVNEWVCFKNGENKFLFGRKSNDAL